MINGTSLLSVAGLARSKSNVVLALFLKVRHVVETGPLNCRGVWIPLERALELANMTNITEELYPLFVHNISALLSHPANRRSDAVMRANGIQIDNGLNGIVRPQ